jgi:hypothetical protein
LWFARTAKGAEEWEDGEQSFPREEDVSTQHWKMNRRVLEEK